MFNAQNLLGGLLKEVISGGSSGGRSGSNLGSKAALGMGALGVAIAAFEHFTQENDNSAQTAANSSRPTAPSGHIPQPPQQNAAPPSAPPPPPMAAVSAAAPPPPVPASALSEGRKVFQETALILIDAMLAAANADGHIDSEEKSKIIQQLKQINSDQEGFDYVQQRIDNPPTLEQICQSTSDPEIAKQVYMVSLLAITVDTAEEADYLNKLASCLPVDAQAIAQLNEQFQTKE